MQKAQALGLIKTLQLGTLAPDSDIAAVKVVPSREVTHDGAPVSITVTVNFKLAHHNGYPKFSEGTLFGKPFSIIFADLEQEECFLSSMGTKYTAKF